MSLLQSPPSTRGPRCHQALPGFRLGGFSWPACCCGPPATVSRCGSAGHPLAGLALRVRTWPEPLWFAVAIPFAYGLLWLGAVLPVRLRVGQRPLLRHVHLRVPVQQLLAVAGPHRAPTLGVATVAGFALSPSGPRVALAGIWWRSPPCGSSPQ
ncbi:hypothetical protein QJS66_21750 [Kocuria rhizophila]|nr:hypothetical protein QJS66_21750 [Kocuria rhizophila]